MGLYISEESQEKNIGTITDIMDTKSLDPEAEYRSALPIVDLSPFFGVSTQTERQMVADRLVTACRDIGFVYIKGYPIARETLEEAFRISQKFYALPREEKMKAPHPPGWSVHRGYSWPGLEKVSNAMSDDHAQETAERLREVQDFKVSKTGDKQ